MIYYLIYKTTNLDNGLIYVGQHTQYDTSAFDGYLGSGTAFKEACKLAVKLYDKHNLD